MALTVAQLRQHVSSNLGDDALLRLLDAAYDAIAERAGAPGNVTEVHGSMRGPLLPLSRRAAAVVSATERATSSTALVLDASDYRLRPSGLVVERLATGINPGGYWDGTVDIVVTPVDDASERDRVAIELVELEIGFTPGVASVSERIGDWQETKTGAAGGQGPGYAAQRGEILDSLHAGAWIR